jgi:uncharacterized protein (DUF433 family)
MSESKTYVSTDDRGTMRVGSAGVMLDGIVSAFEQGDSPESIRQQYPGLTLEEVYGAITFYLAHRSEVAEYLQRQEHLWEYWRAKTEERPSSVVDRLRRLKAEQVPDAT